MKTNNFNTKECNIWHCAYHSTTGATCNYREMVDSGRNHYSIACKIHKVNRWSDGEIEKLTQLYHNTDMNLLSSILKRPKVAIYQKAYKLKLKRDEEVIKLSGFQKGYTPFNKGKKMEEWLSSESLAKIKANQANTAKRNKLNAKPNGTVSKRYNGYYTKVDGVWLRNANINWVNIYGPIPDGMVVVHKESIYNDDVSNLMLSKDKDPSFIFNSKPAERIKDAYRRGAKTRRDKRNKLIIELDKARNSLDYKPNI